MNNQSFDDYMRSVLGFSNMNCPDTCINTPTPYQNMCQTSDDLERMFPDTYRIIQPMVVSSCNMININTPITESMVDRMTDDIYDRAEADSRISVDINIGVENRESENSRQISRMPHRNRFLRDFIRVLLLRELLRRRRRFPFRPF